MIRLLALISLLGGLAWWLHGEQERGRFQQMDRGFLELMLANARDRFVPDPSRLDQVVYLPLKESDKAEYAAWPPQAVDYQMIVKGAAAFQPSMIVITDALNWTEPDSPMIAQLSETLLPIPTVLAIRSAGTATDAESNKQAAERVPSIFLADGSVTLLPESKITAAPASTLSRQAELGSLSDNPKAEAELLSREGTAIRPSPALLAAMRSFRVPLSEVRAVVGGGSALYLGAGHYLPLTDDGQLQTPESSTAVTEQNALDLMTAGMLEDSTGDLAKKMGKGKVLVIGTESATDRTARQQATVLSQTLALPSVEVLGMTGQLITWAVAGLLSLSLIRLPKEKTLKRALLYLLLALVASFLAFQMKTVWFPPAIPALLLLAAGVFLRIFGRKATAPTHG